MCEWVPGCQPGGWGAFLGLTRHPSNPAIWLAGADVGGLFVTQDDAKTWAVCNAGLATRWIYGIEFVGANNIPLLATTAGVYRGTPSAAAGPCVWDFELSNAGLQLSNTTENMASSRFEFRHPVRVLHSSWPAGGAPGEVWAGIGIAKHRAIFGGAARRGDPYHLYKSSDSGQHWQGVLTLPQGAGQILSISGGAVAGAASSVFISTAAA